MNDNFKQVIKSLEESKKLAQSKADSSQQQELLIKSVGALQTAIVESMKVLANSMLGGTINVNDKSNKGVVRTPDALVAAETVKGAIDLVSKNIANLDAIVIKKELDITPIVEGLKALDTAISKLPTSLPVIPTMPKDMAINNLDVLVKAIAQMNKQLQSIEFNPNIKVASPIVNVDLSADLKRLEKAIKEIKPTLTMPNMPEFNTERLEAEIIKVADSINRLEFPVPNIKPSYVSSTGAGTSVQLTSAGRVPVELGISPTIDIGDVQVKDTTGTVIDPSTKQNQTSGAQKTQISKSDGTAVGIRDLSETLIATDHALITSSTIHGKTTGGGGGGGFVDVKVTPSGALTVEATLSTPNTGTVTTASVTNSNTTVLASNNQRLGATIYNEGTVTALIKLGSTASTTSYTVKIITDAYYEVPFGFTGIITGITASGTATLRVTEMT